MLTGQLATLLFSVTPVCLVGSDEAGHVSEDSTAALDDGERVGVAPMSQSSHQECQSTIHGADVSLVFCAVGRQVPERAQYRLQCGLLKAKSNSIRVHSK